jgi:hypothetical protein
MTGPSRVQVMTAGTLVLVAAPFLGLDAALAAPTAKNLYSRSRYVPQLNSPFTMTSGKASWSATLTTVADLQPGGVAGDDNRFALTFRTSKAGPSDGVYTVSRPGFTSTDLFVVADTSRTSFRATVNRI